jgi:glycerol-3-phosphate acyltransferase PlsY
MVCGLAAVAGHLYPVFAGFKGGKGVATALGVMLAAAPLTSLMAASVFLIVWLTWNYISLASMTSALSFPFFLFLFFEPQGYVLPIASILLPLLIVFSHRSNIRKLINGEESKMFLISKRKK